MPKGEGSRDLVFFDLETQFLADEVGGWDNKAATNTRCRLWFPLAPQPPLGGPL